MNQRPFPPKPMGIGAIISNTIATYLKKFGSFAIFTLLINGIFSLVFFVIEQSTTTFSPVDLDALTGLFEEGVFGMRDLQSYLDRLLVLSEQAKTPAWVGIISFTASLFVTPIISGGIACVATGHFLGETHTPGEWLSLVLAKYKALFVANICTLLLLIGVIILLTISFVFLFILFGLITAAIPFIGILLILSAAVAMFLSVLFLIGVAAMVYPIVIRDELGGFSAPIRAFRIGFSKFWKTLGIVFIIGLLVLIASAIVSWILNLILQTAFPAVFFISALVSLIVGWFFDPVTAIALNLNYISYRIEKEGYLSESESGFSGSPYASQPQPESLFDGQSTNLSPTAEPNYQPDETRDIVPRGDESDGSETEEEPSAADEIQHDDDPQGPELL